MRAVITGPAGTPYESGVFVFDLLFPLDYPQVPPKVRPNLVCGFPLFFISFQKKKSVL